MFKDLPGKKEPDKNSSSENQLTEDIFRKIVEASPNAIVLIESNGKIILVNAQTEKLFGYSRDELKGRHVELLIPNRFRMKHSKYRNNYFSHPSTRPMGAGRDLFGLHKNGKEIPVEIGLSPFRSGEEIYTLGSIIDITERKRAEQMFRQVVEASPNAIVLINQQGIIELINVQMEIMFGYERKELIGQSLEVLVPERFRENISFLRDDYFRNPEVRPIGSGTELFGLRKNGSEVPVEIGLTPVESEQGIMVLGSIIDVTERKRAAAKKQEETELAEKHSRELIRLAELERFQKLTIGRELKMIELKKEIEELKKQLNEKNEQA